MQVAGAVWPCAVVVIHVLDRHTLEVAFTADQQPVETFPAGTGNPTLCDSVRVWRGHRRDDDVRAVGGEHVIEPAGELGVPIPDQQPRCPKARDQVAGQFAASLYQLLTGYDR